MIYVVLGMHKSGTSLISRIMHESGINMVNVAEDKLGYGRGNNYERISTSNLNKDILSCYARNSIDVILHNPLVVTPEQRQRMRHIIQDCSSNYGSWGFKDPRTCLTYPAWSGELPDHKLIVVFRSYVEVLRHYHTSGWRKINIIRLRKVLYAWTHYNQQILNHLRDTTNPFIIINYETIMAETSEFERFNQFMGYSLTDARDKKLYRHRSHNHHKFTLLERLMTLTLPVDPAALLKELHQFRHVYNPCD